MSVTHRTAFLDTDRFRSSRAHPIFVLVFISLLFIFPCAVDFAGFRQLLGAR